MNKQKKFEPISNPIYAKAIAELRRSNASGTHLDKRTRRVRTREAMMVRVLREQLD